HGTLTEGEGEAEARRRIAHDWPGARIVTLPNHGRDILPFLHLAGAGWLCGYRAVLKLHTKRSPHRRDGAAWRRRLVAGLLPGPDSPALLERFLNDRDAALWVADGEALSGPRWWGANRDKTTLLLRRIGLRPDDRLRFPAGSMYWIKPHMIALIRALDLDAALFEPEQNALDGTLAHAFERAMGTLATHGGHGLRTTAQLRPSPPPPPPPAFVSAFYLPQFHPTEENSRNWGPGYTEWTALARARARFPGHLQPLLPADLGFYDLRHTDTMGAQARLAAAAGIDAFCVHTYWFDGRMLLDAPLRGLLARPGVPFPFYLCWANESWRRSWDGLSGEVLVEQRYRPGFEARLAADLAPFLRDPRHARPDGTRLRFVIYRPADLPDPPGSIARLRAAWAAMGLGEVEIGGVRFHLQGTAPLPEGTLDFEVEMPPHGLIGPDDYRHTGPGDERIGFEIDSAAFRGLIFDHATLARNALAPERRQAMGGRVIAGVMPAWDTTPRRGAEGHVALGATPATFRMWLRRLRAEGLAHSYRREVFVNAWNEWAEGAVLEPSGLWGHAFCDALREELCR
ncbi:MAG: glycoside hydrolase family 99-like domain-containing protein, partial [Rhodobacteraceae bacterium]|nr:glycoside hydrolase family 99-like domain-containing protein [Paracoccaceae bacterium]